MKRFVSIVVSVALCLIVGFVSQRIQMEPLHSWYPLLNKSSLTPPGWVFSVVWTLLYVLIGISAALLYNSHGVSKRVLLPLFAVQLLLNVLWSYCFFGMQSILLGLAVLFILLVLAVAYFIGLLWMERLAAFFFLPYLLWLFLAVYLNTYMLIFN